MRCPVQSCSTSKLERLDEAPRRTEDFGVIEPDADDLVNAMLDDLLH